MERCPTQAVLPLVGLAAEKVIRDRYSRVAYQFQNRLSGPSRPFLHIGGSIFGGAMINYPVCWLPTGGNMPPEAAWSSNIKGGRARGSRPRAWSSWPAGAILNGASRNRATGHFVTADASLGTSGR
ncbi:MAG: hypothetical protein ACQESR_10245 [Planctomycetota bacterium]